MCKHHYIHSYAASMSPIILFIQSLNKKFQVEDTVILSAPMS